MNQAMFLLFFQILTNKRANFKLLLIIKKGGIEFIKIHQKTTLKNTLKGKEKSQRSWYKKM